MELRTKVGSHQLVALLSAALFYAALLSAALLSVALLSDAFLSVLHLVCSLIFRSIYGCTLKLVKYSKRIIRFFVCIPKRDFTGAHDMSSTDRCYEPLPESRLNFRFGPIRKLRDFAQCLQNVCKKHWTESKDLAYYRQLQ